MLLKLMAMPRALGCAAFMLFPLAAASAPADPFPTPGLYRVETDATTKYHDGTGRAAALGATGGAVVEGQGAGRAPTRRVLPGAAPATICMAARPVNGGLPLPRSSCRGAPPVVGPNGTTFTAACGFMDTTTVVRKIDARTWEYKVTSVERLGAENLGGMPDFAVQKRMFEQTARNGSTAEERADAAGVLADWPAYEAEARASAAPGAQSSRNTEIRKTTMVTRLTRIAETCRTPAAR